MASHSEQAMDQADAHITLSFMDASLNPKTEQMVRISEISKPLVNANKPCIIAVPSTTSPPSVEVPDVNLKVVKEKATSENSKPSVNIVKEPACTARTSTSAASMDAIDMNLKGVKETKGPVASLITTAGNRKRCFARQSDDHVAKVHKPNVSVQVKEKVTPTSTASMDAHDTNLEGVKESEGPVVSLITTARKLKRCFAQTENHVAKVCKPIIGVQVKEKVTSDISKSILVDANKPCINGATSTSTDSVDAIDMYLMGVKEKGPVASLPTATLKSRFAQSGPVAKLRKTEACLQVHKELSHLVKPDESLKSGDRAMKRYIKLLDMDLPGGDRSSVRDACLALNPLLNTKNLSKIECFMRHRGLHVLYEMLRYFLPIFEGRPVLRKLMKTLQHLHDRKMLGVEHMQCDAPRFCMLKFSKLLYDLSEHEDLEVRTTARSFQGLRFSIPQKHPSHAKCCRWERRTRH